MQIESRETCVSLAQRYWNFDWDEARNRAAYGRLASPAGVGANLRVRLNCSRERDLQPGLALIKRYLDHRALPEDEPRFARDPSSLEAITAWMRDVLSAELISFAAVDLFDGPRLRCRGIKGAADLDVSERIGNLVLTRRLSLERGTGLGVRRDEAGRAVRAIAGGFARPFAGSRVDWARNLADAISREMSTLRELRVDLGPGSADRVLVTPRSQFETTFPKI